MGAVLNASDQIISFNPTDGSEIGRLPVLSNDELKLVVDRSRKALADWKSTKWRERKDLLLKARQVILKDIDGIAGLISQETGKPVGEAIAMEIAPVLDLMQWVARRAEHILSPERVGIGLYALLGRNSKIVYHPLGVILIIPAWNYPFSIPLGEAAMALAAGNTVIIKPSELTPFVGMKIGEIFAEAGYPADAVQVVPGDGVTGAALVDLAPDKIMFTGSVATGKKIAASAARDLTPLVLELGGKDPMIVFDDADLGAAASAAVWGAFCNAGQSCSSVERLYVQEGVLQQLTEMIVAKTRQVKVGPGVDENVSVGAMSSERQIAIVESHVDEFRRAGAEILTGGKRNADLGSLFYQPTVIAGAVNDMLPMREETFGPTLPIASFKTEAEAIRLANDSEFGLTASVWTRDLKKGRRVAEKIEAGSVCINEVLYTHGIGQTPWGGFKNSGRGRTHGAFGLREMVQPQHIHTNRFTILPDAWWMPYSPTAVETFRGFAKYFASGSILKTSLLLPQLFRRIKELISKEKENNGKKR